MSFDKIRSFIAVDVTDNRLVQEIVKSQTELSMTGGDMKAVEPENIHATLRFLGDVPPSLVDQVKNELSQINVRPFQIELRGIGAFPDAHRPNVIWVGITKGEEDLQKILSELEPRLRGLGFVSEKRGFSPHITIARVKSGRNRDALHSAIVEMADREFGLMDVLSIRFKKSTLTPKGPIYSTIYELKPKS